MGEWEFVREAEKLKFFVVSDDSRVSDVAMNITQTGVGTSVICDSTSIVIGVVTDSDLRQHFMKGGGLSDSVSDVVNRAFIYCSTNDLAVGSKKNDLEAKGCRLLPVLGSGGNFEGAHLLKWRPLSVNTKSREIAETVVFIQAGGLGTRLSPLTDIVPKPLMSVRGKPILLGTIENFIRNGYKTFVVSLCYKPEMFLDKFKEWEAQYDISLEVIHESSQLGTGGCVLKYAIEHSCGSYFFVVNADTELITDFQRAEANFLRLGAQLGVFVTEYRHSIPYGCILLEGDRIVEMREKPEVVRYINTGWYIVDRDAIQGLNIGKRSMGFDEIINKMLEENLKVVPLALSESDQWQDYGQWSFIT